MKKFKLYKKWNLLNLVNNTISLGFLILNKQIHFIKSDTTSCIFWIYSKKIQLKHNKILSLKKRFNWL